MHDPVPAEHPIAYVILGLGMLCTLVFLVSLVCLLLSDLWRRLRGRPGTIAWREECQSASDWLTAWGAYLPVRLWCIGQTLVCLVVAPDIAISALLRPELAWEDQRGIIVLSCFPLAALLIWFFVLPFGRRFWSQRPVTGWRAWAWCSMLPVAGIFLMTTPAFDWFPRSWAAFWPFYTIWAVTCCLFWSVVLRQYPAGELLTRKR